jgi:cephalosporin-C deacetylase-like acetyl esterase
LRQLAIVVTPQHVLSIGWNASSAAGALSLVASALDPNVAHALAVSI